MAYFTLRIKININKIIIKPLVALNENKGLDESALRVIVILVGLVA